MSKLSLEHVLNEMKSNNQNIDIKLDTLSSADAVDIARYIETELNRSDIDKARKDLLFSAIATLDELGFAQQMIMRHFPF